MKLPLAVCAVFCVALPAAAGPDRVPVEMPPPDYAGQTFTDTRGCVFVRLEIEGQRPIWVERLDASDAPHCPKSAPGDVIVAKAG